MNILLRSQVVLFIIISSSSNDLEAQGKRPIEEHTLNRTNETPDFYQTRYVPSISTARMTQFPRANPVGPELILYNANVLTMDNDLPNAEAVAIDSNLIVAVGVNVDVLALQTANTALVDLQGRTVVPGLIEAHSHRLLHGFWSDGPEGLARATQTMAANGYTTVHELFGDQGLIEWAQALAQEGRLAVRINAYPTYNTNCSDDTHLWNILPYTTKKDTTLRIAGVKIFADGGSCGCSAITSTYQGRALDYCGEHGQLFKTQEEMNAAVQEVLAAGYPIAMHALGDWGVQVGLNAFENAFSEEGNTLRCRMEHLRVMREDLANQMAALGVLASIQNTWAKASGASTWETIYESSVLDWVYPWRRMMDLGIPIVSGNDAPYTSRATAMQTLSILATRKAYAYEVLPDWLDGDRLTIEEGLRAMTVTNAWAAFEEDVKGTVTPGKLADLTVLSDDPLAIDPFEVRYITTEMTIMDGIIRYDKRDIAHIAVHDAGVFSMGFDDRGLWGPFRAHEGLMYHGVDHLWQGYPIISYDNETVGSGCPHQQDFIASPGGWVDFREPGIIADEEATVVYEDAAQWHPSTIRITQETAMWNDDSLLLVIYTFENVGDESLTDLYFGQLMDFDVGAASSNMGAWEENNGLGFAYLYDASDPNTTYLGMSMFDHSDQDVNVSLSFIRGSGITPHNEHVFSAPMRANTIATGTPEPADYVVLMSMGPFSLDIDESEAPFTLAFVVGDNLNDLKDAVNKGFNLDLMGLDPKGVLRDFALHQNYPNPFNPITSIHYDLPHRGEVTLTVYDILGREVARLVDGYTEPGYHQTQWNGRDQKNRSVPSGIYIARLMTPEYTKSIKMLLLK